MIPSNNSPSAMLANLVTVAQSPDLGRYLTDPQGKTLYIYTKDSKNQSVCNMTDNCELKWPPYLAPSNVGGGILPTATSNGQNQMIGQVNPQYLGTVTRQDGKVQISYNGWPYRSQ